MGLENRYKEDTGCCALLATCSQCQHLLCTQRSHYSKGKVTVFRVGPLGSTGTYPPWHLTSFLPLICRSQPSSETPHLCLQSFPMLPVTSLPGSPLLLFSMSSMSLNPPIRIDKGAGMEKKPGDQKAMIATVQAGSSTGLTASKSHKQIPGKGEASRKAASGDK